MAQTPLIPFLSSRAAALGSAALCAALLALHAGRFDDAARFAGDTWEYQSVAVNLVKGRGFPKFGQAEPLSEYRFEPGADAAPHYTRFLIAGRAGGLDHFGRTPGYPVFLAAVYAVFGVSPLAAKLVQAGLLLFVAVALVRVGRELWGDVGAACGAVAGPVYAAVYGYQAGTILTEPLIAFSLSLVALAYLRWRRIPDVAGAAALGAACACSLLVKASNVFIPPALAVLMCAGPASAGSVRRRARDAALALWALGLLLAPYCVYATLRSGQFIVFSTQGGNALLDNNNEFSLAKKAWAPEWRADPAAFYNRPELAGLGAVAKVRAFYAGRPRDLLRAARYKLEAGFRNAVFLKAVLAALLLDGLLRLPWGALWAAPWLSPRAGRLALLGALGLLACAAASGLVSVISLALGAAAVSRPPAAGALIGLFPGLHAALLANFALIFVLFDGAPRFFSVVEPFFILLSIRYASATVLGPHAWADSLARRGAA